jgi:hypothetical protein
MDVKIKNENNKLIIQKKNLMLPILIVIAAATLFVHANLLVNFIINKGKIIEFIGISIVPAVIFILCWQYYKWNSGRKIVFDNTSKTIFFNGKPLAYYKHVKSVSTHSDIEKEQYKVIIHFTNNKSIVAALIKNIHDAKELQNKIQKTINL